MLLLFLMPVALLTALTALTFLWMTALLNGIEFRQPPRQVVRRRAIRLPFHPLFPGLVLAISLLLSFSLDRTALLVGGVWLLASALLYYGGVRGRVHRLEEGAFDLPRPERRVGRASHRTGADNPR
ncbi:MAG: hypothetical protein HC802_20020 [Caldilineaceae bacterium]|nr:hypothetical protein [Caldilineaceae bacterium]